MLSPMTPILKEYKEATNLFSHYLPLYFWVMVLNSGQNYEVFLQHIMIMITVKLTFAFGIKNVATSSSLSF